MSDRGETMSKNEEMLDSKQFEKVSQWALDNAPAIIAITITSIVGSVLGLVAGVGLYAFLNYYKKGAK